MTKQYVKKRIQTLFQHLETPVDAIVVKNATQPYIDSTFFYVTGLPQGTFEGSLAFLYPEGTVELVVPKLEEETAKKISAPLHVYSSKVEKDAILKTLTQPLHVLGLHFSSLLHHDFYALQTLCPDATIQDVSSAITATRLIKDTEELDFLRQACRIADKVMSKVPSFVHENIREFELAAEIDYHLQKYGAEKPAFTTISSFGKNTAEPHYSHAETRLQSGDFILCDFGACFQRYNSDITRTFVYGTAQVKQKDMYHTVLQAQSQGLHTIRSGIAASEVHRTVASSIDKTAWKGHFIHSTGHSLGLSVHDGPGFTADSTLILKENMVLTIEPGVYLPGYGGVRIEDDIIIKKEGVELLTKSSKDFTEI